jgi:phosphoglycerate dehydrogenase-like enzyme
VTARIVLAPSAALLDELGAMPDGFELALLDAGAEPSPRELGAEAMVLGAEFRHLVPRLAEFGGLRLIQTLNAGVETMLPHVPAGVTFCNASGVHDVPVAEWAVGMVIAMRRGFPRFFGRFAAGEWDDDANALTTPPDQIPFDDLDGARVLIVGYGSIGRRIESLLTPFGATFSRVAFTARPGVHTPDQLDTLLPHADVVILMAPLTEMTRGLLDARRLALLPDGALIVNGARGAMIDQAALEDELRAGRLHAALDVTDPEPLPPGHSLWSAPNLMITPHTAGSSKRWMRRAYRFAGVQLHRYGAGDPLENIRTTY